MLTLPFAGNHDSKKRLPLRDIVRGKGKEGSLAYLKK